MVQQSAPLSVFKYYSTTLIRRTFFSFFAFMLISPLKVINVFRNAAQSAIAKIGNE
jgi:hypothetical protein